MIKKCLCICLMWGGLFVGIGRAESENTSSAALVFASFREDYDLGGGAALTFDVAENVAIYLGLEYVHMEDDSSYGDATYFSKTVREVDGFEIQLGYLHRILRREGMSLQLGPVVGFEEMDGEERTSYGGIYGSGSSSVSVDYELGLSASLQALFRARVTRQVELLAVAAFGYRGAREVSYGHGGVVPLMRSSENKTSEIPWNPFDEGSTTFVRVAIGLAIPF